MKIFDFIFFSYTFEKKKNQQDMLSGKAIKVSHLLQIDRSREDFYFEKWHIFRGWKHSYKICEECDHHSHLYCERCKKVAEGIYKRCECPWVIWSIKQWCKFTRHFIIFSHGVSYGIVWSKVCYYFFDQVYCSLINKYAVIL